MLSRELYIYAVPRYIVITNLTLRTESHPLAIPNGTSMQTTEYELLRIHLLGTSVNKDKKGGGIASSPMNRTTRLSIDSLVGKSLDRLNPARLAEFVCATVDVVVPIVRLAHPMPGQSRIEHGDGPLIRFLTALGAFVQVLGHHEVERHGVQMIAEAEVRGNGRESLGATSGEDDGVVVGEDVVAVILESALPAHGSESSIPVEDVVVLAAVFSLTGIVAEHIGKSRLLHPAHVLLAPQVSAPVAYEGVDVRPIEGLGQALGLGIV